mmetsp:Transcript_41913/g.133784  ORF Transcript_41913/g.133784 Transcript_41913/m.133784 type:complete len:146 (+) Transcript_41913:63-500(+)
MRPALVLLALAAVALGAGEWVAIDGIKTTYQIKSPAKDEGADLVKQGVMATVHAKGTVKQTGKAFWNTRDTNEPFTYKAGVGGVIKGWDQGLLGAKVGEVRSLDIPADEGYGERGFPAWGIPPGGGLVFEIEVLSVRKESNHELL